MLVDAIVIYTTWRKLYGQRTEEAGSGLQLTLSSILLVDGKVNSCLESLEFQRHANIPIMGL